MSIADFFIWVIIGIFSYFFIYDTSSVKSNNKINKSTIDDDLYITHNQLFSLFRTYRINLILILISIIGYIFIALFFVEIINSSYENINGSYKLGIGQNQLDVISNEIKRLSNSIKNLRIVGLISTASLFLGVLGLLISTNKIIKAN